MRDVELIDTDDSFLTERVAQFAQAMPWVSRGGILSDVDTGRRFSVKAVEGFVKFLQTVAIPCNSLSNGRRMHVGKMRRWALEYQQASASLHGYRKYHGTTGEFVLAAYMTGFAPLMPNKLTSTDGETEYISYFPRVIEVLDEMANPYKSRWWVAYLNTSRETLPVFCLINNRAIERDQARSIIEQLLQRRVLRVEKTTPPIYLP